MGGLPKSASDSALVLFSGGQDSTTCLAWALDRYARVETVGFLYGQRHAVEMETRPVLRQELARLKPEWATRLGPDHVLDLTTGFAGLGETALTSETEIRMRADGLPNTFVPGRNLVFLTYAAALAYRRGIGRVVGGMCQTDYSGYPDCRDDTIRALETAIGLGLGQGVCLEMPLMFIDKAATWQLAETLGGSALITLIVQGTHTCYLGDHSTRHEWGLGCGACPACQLRAQGWHAWHTRGLSVDVRIPGSAAGE